MYSTHYVCFKCGTKYEKDVLYECKKCHYSLDIVYDYAKIKKEFDERYFFQTPVKHLKYYAFYPIKDPKKIVSMQEGGTPLLQSKQEKNFFFKLEGCNPTGVFKDRGSSIEITKALEFGAKKVVCASTGNMGASISAYARRAGIQAEIFVPKFAEKVKLKQMKFYGAEIKVINGTYTKVL
ncbi:MAG: pyridoxal-phosphate dependent enzyme, partial [Candidatus Diapherotrites archaeon]|nr:pyridoxal-phosphate dependent enzyme [Candidatus Diapherotrites archaeon]